MLSRYSFYLTDYSAHIGQVETCIRLSIRLIFYSRLPIVAREHFFESATYPNLCLDFLSCQRVLLGQSDRRLTHHRLWIHGCGIVAHEKWTNRDDGAIEATCVTQKKEKCVGLALIFVLDVREREAILQDWQVLLRFLVRKCDFSPCWLRDLRFFPLC